MRYLVAMFLVACGLLTQSVGAQSAGIITTAAGNGTGGDTDDGGPATSAEIELLLQGMTPDTQGNLYILQGGAFIRKVNSAGIITTIAGGGQGLTNNTPALQENLNVTGIVADNQGNYYLANGQFVLKVDAAGTATFFAGTLAGPGDSGDGGPATSAQVEPSNLAFDGGGNLYICEVNSNRIRKVDTNGIITTVAGTGQPGYTGDGGPAISAKLQFPQGMTVDTAGNIYFADNFGYIRKVNTSGVISTIAGNGKPPAPGEGTAALSTGMVPVWVAVDGAGNLYYVDSLINGRVRQINTSGFVNTVAGNVTSFTLGDGGPALSAWLQSPTGVAVDNSGNIYIADIGHNRVRKVTGVAVPGNAGSVTGAAPSISSNGVVNGASFGPGLVVGSWATVQGTNLAASTGEWDVVNGILPIQVNDVTVDFGGNDAYVYYVSPTQINFIVPDVRTGTQQVTVANAAGTSQTVSVTVDNFAPAFFLWPNNQVVATSQDFTYAAASGTFTGVTSTPAKPGGTIILWGTGFGPTDPAFPQGMVTPTTGGPYKTDPVTVTIDNLPATVYGAALAPGFAGLYQIAIEVPNALGTGNWPVVATIGGVSSLTGPVLAVQ
jgi:uncharacterized protein (TIGR03437 family)